MKKIFTLITSILCSISLFAGIPQTRLTVSTNLKSPVIVLVDGQSLNSQRDNRNDDELIINNLSAGYHNIKIYQKNAVRGWGYRTQVIYDGNVYVKPGYHVDVTLNRFGRALIDERQITRDDYDEYDDNIGRSYPGNPQNQGNEPYPRNQQYPSNGGGGYDNENQAMNAGSFAQFRYMLGNISFEDSRLVMARQNIEQNSFNVTQVKQIMELFYYEANRLELAKLAYRRTIDKQYYFAVNDALTYNSSREELARYIRQSGY